MILGVIADDFTGATDVASMLVRAGMRTVQVLGVPDPQKGALPEADAVVIALKTRTIAPADAVAQSLAALQALRPVTGSSPPSARPCGPLARARSISSTARPSIPRPRATSARSPTR